MYNIDRINNFIRFIRSDMRNLTYNLSIIQVIDFASFNYFEKSDLKKINAKKHNNEYDSKEKTSIYEKNNESIYKMNPSILDNFERTIKFNKNDNNDIINKFSNELNNPLYKIDFSKNKGLSKSKSQAHSINFNQNENGLKINEDDYGKIMVNNDLDKIKKNYKLLELIVVIYGF